MLSGENLMENRQNLSACGLFLVSYVRVKRAEEIPKIQSIMNLKISSQVAKMYCSKCEREIRKKKR